MINDMKSARARLALSLLNHQMKKARTMSVREARDFFEKSTATRRWPRIQTVIDDTVKNIPIRIYQNKHSNDHGIILFFHGGGFTLGSINTHDSIARLLCRYTNRSVISVGYSLAPEHKHPTPIIEGLGVLDQLPVLSEKYGFNIQNITLAGDSAGGFIALHIALRTNVPIDSLVLLYSMIQPDATTESMKKFGNSYYVTAANIRSFWKQYLSDEPITPLTNHTIDMLPPTLIITAEYDVLHDEARDLYALMRNQGKACQYEEAEGKWHGFMHWPTAMSGRIKMLGVIKKFIAMHQTR